MKKILLIICMFFTLSFSSCIVGEYATTQDDLYYGETYSEVVRSNVNIDIVLAYGTPYYYNGSILYYLYEGLYYYPFYYDNYWYMRVYRRPFDHLRYRPYFRPNRHDYRFNRDFRHPRDWRPDPGHRNPNRFGNNRNQPRPDTRPNQPRRDAQPNRVPQPNQQVIPQQQTQPQQRQSTFGGNRNVTPTTPSRGVSTPPARTGSNTPARTGGGGRFGGGRR